MCGYKKSPRKVCNRPISVILCLPLLRLITLFEYYFFISSQQTSCRFLSRAYLAPTCVRNGGGCKVSTDYVNHLRLSFLPNTSSWTLCSRFGLDKITLVKRLQCRQFSERSLIAALYFSTRFSAASFISSNLVRSLLWLKSASFTVFAIAFPFILAT